jgi:hypothetical protein
MKYTIESEKILISVAKHLLKTGSYMLKGHITPFTDSTRSAMELTVKKHRKTLKYLQKIK